MAFHAVVAIGIFQGIDKFLTAIGEKPEFGSDQTGERSIGSPDYRTTKIGALSEGNAKGFVPEHRDKQSL